MITWFQSCIFSDKFLPPYCEGLFCSDYKTNLTFEIRKILDLIWTLIIWNVPIKLVNIDYAGWIKKELAWLNSN